MNSGLLFCDLAVAGVRGLSPYQPGKPIEELERELGITGIVKLASNENPLGASPRALEAAAAAMSETHRYPDGSGFLLKQALSAHHQVAPEQITLGNGSNDLLDVLARVFLEPGREAVVSQYAFAIYALSTQAVGAQCVTVPALGPDSDMPYGHDLEAMADAITERTAIVFVANPNNPTGTWLTQAQLERFLDRVPRRVVVVLDEAYTEYARDLACPDGTQWLARYPNLVVTRTFSKAYGLAGLRVGYSLSSLEIADLLNRVRHPFNVNSLALAAAEAALDDCAHIEQSVALNAREMKRLCAAFDAAGLKWLPSAGNFISVEIGNAAAAYQALLRRGVIVRPMAGYGLPSYLRVSVGLAEENSRFLIALDEYLEEAR